MENETCEALGGCVERLERARMRVLEVLEAMGKETVWALEDNRLRL